MKKYAILFFCLIGIAPLMRAQIVNMENKRIATDTTGFSGKMGVSLSAARFTQSFIAADISGQVQWKTNKNLYLLVGDFQIVNAGGESFNNSGFGHIRYNRKFGDVIRGELFTQIQYNSVTKITKRILNGIGIRFKLSPHETAKIYWGLALMNEYEEVSDPKIINKDNRMSSYFTFTLAPVENIILRNTTYIQPKLADFKDYRLANNTQLSFGITDQLKFTTVFNFLYDSRPPAEVPTINYQVKNGLSYTF
ncbi:MAG: DUF481 domain-containing protein [Saprospiraceae bacterium]|nr:DUF481 domain-containing protein [Saprospiraceae bacterium]